MCTFLKPPATLTISLGWLPTDELSPGMSQAPSNSGRASLNLLVPPCGKRGHLAGVCYSSGLAWARGVAGLVEETAVETAREPRLSALSAYT